MPDATRRGRRYPTSVWIAKAKTKNGTSYRLRWIDPLTGRTLSQSCGRDQALARRLRDQKRSELRDGLTGRLPGRSVQDLIDALDGFMAGRAWPTVRKTKRSLEDLIELCGDRLLEHLGRDTVMDFRAKRLGNGVGIASVNKDVRQIRSALSYAVEAGWIRFNPLLRWKKAQLREPERVVHVVEADEFEAILNATPDPAFRVLLHVAYHQGLRRSELANLRWNAVDLRKRAIHVVNVPQAGELTKSRKNRTIPMHPTVRRELAAMRAEVPTIVRNGRQEPKHPHVFTKEDGKRYDVGWITRRFRDAADRAGVECCLHDLRRSFSTLAQRAGVDRLTVKDLGGWSSATVVERHYTGEIQPALEAAMERIARAEGAA